MILVNIIAFTVLKRLHNLFSMHAFCLQITAKVIKLTKGVYSDLTFTFIELSETFNNFMKIHLVLEKKYVVMFI